MIVKTSQCSLIFCSLGSLDNYLFSERNITAIESIQLLSKIAKGILYLHKNNVVHRDLATRNILVSNTKKIKGLA